MRVLVAGSGAREHALTWKLASSPLVEALICAPGNGGTAAIAENRPVAADDAVGIARLAREAEVDLVVLGPEAAIAAGAGDLLREAGIPVFGPNREAGRIESSKAFAKELMVRAGIPTAAYGAFRDPDPALRMASRLSGQVAIKADGLAQGKGVYVCRSLAEAEAAVSALLRRRELGPAGDTVVVEELLEGPEVSLLAITDGTAVCPLVPARDFKRAHDGDLGPNTGGMGAYSPPIDVDQELARRLVADLVEPALAELGRRGLEYRGVLYAGIMLTADGPRVLEFNARFGDPETQVVLPRLKSDLAPLLLAAARGRLAQVAEPQWSPRPAVGVVVASGGYPGAYRTGLPIDLPAASEGLLFHAGTRLDSGGRLLTSGGRVVTAVGLGDTVAAARDAAMSLAQRVRFPGAFFRRDIAREATG